MSNDEKVPSTTPAYVSFTTFKGALQGLVHDKRLPPRLDSSVLSHLSGSTRAQFMNSLRYLGLVGKDDVPTETGHALANANADDWKRQLATILGEKYPNQLSELSRGTPQTYKDSFSKDSPSIIVPAARFLWLAAKDAGLPVSPHIGDRGISASKPSRSTSSKVKTLDSSVPSIKTVDEASSKSFSDRLLDKFPAFDPDWDEQRQAAWFSAYERLLRINEKP